MPILSPSGEYFDTTELRALPDVDDESRFTDAELVAAHDWIVAIIERECETSFIGGSVTETLNGSGGSALFLSEPYVQSVESVTVDGVALTSAEIAVLLVQNGAVYYSSGAYWPASARGNITVTYTAGYSAAVPEDLKQAALRAARNWLLTTDAWSGVDTRATSISNEYGNIQLSIASADGRPTGIPDVDATITAWARRVRVPRVS